MAITAARYPQDKEPEDSASLKFAGNGKIAILTVRGFYGSAEKKELSDYFDGVFRQIQQRNPGSLIIDLRNNGGGRDFLGFEPLAEIRMVNGYALKARGREN